MGIVFPCPTTFASRKEACMSESTSTSASIFASTTVASAGSIASAFPTAALAPPPAAESPSPTMHYVGLDVHLKRSSICILDAHGKQVKRLEVKGHWPAVLAEIQCRVPRPFAICYEASC